MKHEPGVLCRIRGSDIESQNGRVVELMGLWPCLSMEWVVKFKQPMPSKEGGLLFGDVSGEPIVAPQCILVPISPDVDQAELLAELLREQEQEKAPEVV